MSALGLAKGAAETLSKTNGFVVVLHVLVSVVMVFLGLMAFGSDSNTAWLLIALGVVYLVSSIIAYQIIEAFSAHVLVNTEILQELQKANGYK